MRHVQNCLAALGEMSRHRVGSLLIIGVVGVALAVPAAFNVVVMNGRALAGGWDELRDFSVYLRPGVTIEDAETLREQIETMDGVGSTQLITADEALETFGNDEEFSATLAALDRNPLPHTLVVRPAPDAPAELLGDIEQYLNVRTDVELVKLDTDWVARLNAILDLARRAVTLAALVLAGAVVVIIGNTIRLDIQNKRAEIEVSKLLGAGLWILSGPVDRLIALYGGAFEPVGLGFAMAGAVLAGGIAAGLGGAWAAVARHLSVIQPNV